MQGVEEEASVFEGRAAFAGLERFRTFGVSGPLYEILDTSSDRLTIQVIESGEILTYPAAAAVADPRA